MEVPQAVFTAAQHDATPPGQRDGRQIAVNQKHDSTAKTTTAQHLANLPRRRRKIAVINQKGGATKTTTTVNLGAALVALGRRVRIIDLDPQAGSSTLWLPPTSDAAAGILRVFQDTATLDEATATTSIPGLYIVPSYTSLREIERTRPAGTEVVLRSAMAESSAPVDYDLVDCPHSLDVLAIAGIAAVEELIIPVQASKLDVAGMDELLQLAKMIKKRLNPELEISALIVGRVKGNSGLDKRLIETFRQSYPKAIVLSIADSVKMREATELEQPINLFEPEGKCARDFRALADALENRKVAA